MVIGKEAKLFSTEAGELHEFQFKVNLKGLVKFMQLKCSKITSNHLLLRLDCCFELVFKLME